MHRTLRVLVVDDSCDNAESLATLIRLWGHCCFVANDGPEALAAMEAARPDVVLTELLLGPMSGYELARRLRADRRWDGVLLLAATVCGEKQARQATAAAGFDFHMLKPVNPGFLHDLLAHWGTRIGEPATRDEGSPGT